jgi:phospholipid-binding lipoprotein MlaA
VKHIKPLCIILLLSLSLIGYAQNQTKPKNEQPPKNNSAQQNNNAEKNDNHVTDEQQKDPYEGYNRAMFKFNEDFDDYILKPVAKTYNALMLPPVNNATHNALNNLSEIPTVINDLLQFNFYKATSDSWRFVVNSTVGIGGILDVASKIDLTPHYEDIGLTLAKWGWSDSNYFIIPFLGPSTIRDAIGLIPYYYITVYPYIKDWRWRYAALALRMVDIRAQLLRFEKTYEEIALDPYVFMRSAYFQRRKYLMEENNNIDDPYTEEDTKKTAADNNEEAYYLDDV